jgi:hypothetical protein
MIVDSCGHKATDLSLNSCSLTCKCTPNTECVSVYDLNNIRLSGALYVRKVARAIDPNMYKILPVDLPQQIPPISWPSDVRMSPVPYFREVDGGSQ